MPANTPSTPRQKWPRLNRLLLTAAAIAWSQHALAQNLLELTTLARSHDPSLRSVQAEFEASISKEAQAKAGLLPQIGVQTAAQYGNARTSYDYAGQHVNNQLGSHQYSAAVQATQPLYHPANVAQYHQGQKGVSLAKAKLENAEQDLLIRTATAYFDVLDARDALELVKAQKKAIAEQLAYAQRNFELGTATVIDAREAQSRFDLVSAQEIAASNELQVRQAALEQLVGITGLSIAPLKPSISLMDLYPLQLNHWLNTAQSSHPLLHQAQIALEISQLETDKAQAGHKPTIELQATYGTQRNPEGLISSPGASEIRSHAGSIGVVMNIPLFSGFATQSRIRETLALQDKAQADLDDAKQQVLQAVRTAYYGVQSAYERVRALETAVQSSQSALEANELGYEVGIRINVDVLNAQSQLFQAKRDLSQARYQLLTGHLKLRQTAGTLGIQDIADFNQFLTASSH